MFRIDRMKNGQSPHGGERDERALQCVRMNRGHGGRSRTLDQQDRAMRTVSQSGRLWEESAIGQGCGKVGDRLAFDQDLIVDQVVPGRESDHLNVEGAFSSYDVEQRRMMFRVIDIKSVK